MPATMAGVPTLCHQCIHAELRDQNTCTRPHPDPAYEGYLGAKIAHAPRGDPRQWRFDEDELRIDTAPLHPELSTFPHHLHDSQGNLHSDLLTVPGRSPWDNIRAVLDVVLKEPLAVDDV